MLSTFWPFRLMSIRGNYGQQGRVFARTRKKVPPQQRIQPAAKIHYVKRQSVLFQVFSTQRKNTKKRFNNKGIYVYNIIYII